MNSVLIQLWYSSVLLCLFWWKASLRPNSVLSSGTTEDFIYLGVLWGRQRPQSTEQCSCLDSCFCSDQAPCFTTFQREIPKELFLISDSEKCVCFLSLCAGMSFMAVHNLSSKTVCVCGRQSLILLDVQGQNWSWGSQEAPWKMCILQMISAFFVNCNRTHVEKTWLSFLAVRVLAFD